MTWFIYFVIVMIIVGIVETVWQIHREDEFWKEQEKEELEYQELKRKYHGHN